MRLVSRTCWAFALVLGLAGSAAGEQVPLSAVFSAEYTVIPIPNTPTAFLDVDGVGAGSPLGLFGIEIPHVVHFPTGTATGTYRLTTLGGEVNGTFTGFSTPIGTEGVYVLVEEAVTITGGTGQFAGATGSFTTIRLVDRVNLRTIGFIDGTISRPGRGPGSGGGRR